MGNKKTQDKEEIRYLKGEVKRLQNEKRDLETAIRSFLVAQQTLNFLVKEGRYKEI